MNVLMYGWEFPPYSSGGLGTACYGLTKSLSKNNVHITFVVPYAKDMDAGFLNLVSSNITLKQVDSPLKPYISSAGYTSLRAKGLKGSIYGESLFEEVNRYAEEAKRMLAMHRPGASVSALAAMAAD